MDFQQNLVLRKMHFEVCMYASETDVESKFEDADFYSRFIDFQLKIEPEKSFFLLDFVDFDSI